MSSLPEEMRAQNLMCYIGHEGTYTPAHREMCASLGQNIMVDASGDTNGEKPGSSIWFMTETKDREVVREYFLSMLGHDVEIEKHFAQVNAWKKATFPVYVVEQKVGDFILVPPLAPHQVWNRGTRTIKVAWNRTTVETLEMALHEALPKARLVCRDEQYKNKAIVYYTLQKYYKELTDMERTVDIGLLGFGQDLIRNSPRRKQLAADFKALFGLFTEILVDEMFATKEKDVEYVPFDSNITCSYCRANIFNRFLTCKHCVRELVDGDEDTYDVCMECYAMGRSCLCVSNLSWCEQWKWPELVDRYEEWRAMVIQNDGCVDFQHSPLPLELARKRTGKKSVAQICQEQLRRRPWKDLTAKVDEPVEEESEPEIDENGRPKKKKKRQRKKKEGEIHRCHVCSHKDYTYKLAFCSNAGCTEAYCYGVLYRAFDMMPQNVMQNERWVCPRCLGICNCGSCRRTGVGNPYIPKNTLLGHDTRPIADDRSVETLVDFRVHNLSWLSKVDESRSLSSKRMQRLKQAADAEKAKEAHLAHEVPALPDAESAESLDAAMQQQHAANGYGDQSHILGPGGEHEMAAPGVHDQQQPQNGVDQGRQAESASDQSAYPDPSMLGHERMLGMGYYEQDDSPDRILFDPYQMPSAESMAIDSEPEISEYLKKQLRAAKRKARQEGDDDPDFAGPRSRHRKRQRLGDDMQPDGQQEALNNMDPALFNEVTMLDDAPGDEDAPGEAERPTAENGQSADAEAADADAEADGQEHRPYSPNRPALRHARPKIGYVDEGREEEFDELYIPKPRKRPEQDTAAAETAAQTVPTGDPLDLASAAIRALAGGAAQESPPVPVTGEKRRGPGRPRKSETQAAQATDGAAANTETPQTTKKRRGRPPRSSLPATTTRRRSGRMDGGDSDEDDEDAAPANHGGGADDDDDFAGLLDGFDDDGEVVAQSSTTRNAARPSSTSGPPRRRGRPPKNAQPQTQTETRTTTVTVELPSSTTFMSMAERMRLKGKKVKIGQRKSINTTAETSSPAMQSGSRSGAGWNAVNRPSTQITETEKTESAKTAKTTRTTRRRTRRGEDSDEDEEFDPAAEEEPVSDEEEAEVSAPRIPSPSPPPAVQEPEPEPEPVDEPEPQPEPEPEPEDDESYREPSPTPPPVSRGPSASVAPPLTIVSVPSPTQSPSPSPPPPPPPKPAGPTIVRLADSDEEEEESGYGDFQSAEESQVTSEDDDDSDDNDEDIPAQRAAPAKSGFASRGSI
ncbi:hypothetical protein QBC46DRAFT_377431, partial [Diplogelasinospora grovesii]